uniref:N-acetyltransferase domain-containing protein n=1 Tax=Chlamydomonas leiostraca TaxID=1034604 RepID=A0A7S0WTU9_9CHLO|mmetsp:Transcript_28486/g.72482  ORF Transcript_28486/g.72482 Transcript_28486/m.72482 type:complete len:105 (+) Transcript_28486:1-315(+)
MRSQGDELTHETMSTHDPDGVTLCVHSVCVREDMRRKGVALKMLKAYLQYVQATTPLKSVRLICKSGLIPLYEKAGFQLVGPSSVVHGQDPWFECAYVVDDGDE